MHTRRRHPSRIAPLTRRLTVAGLVVLCAAAPALGCGSGDEPSRTTTTAVDEDAWVADLESDCASLNEKFAHLATSDPSDAAEARDYAEQIDDFAEAMEAVLRDAEDRLSTSDPRAADLRALLELTVELEAATTALADGAASGETSAIEDSTAEVTRLGGEINSLAEDLDVASCGGF